MYLLLLILFTIKVYARINIFKVVTRKHGQGIFKVARNLEDLLTKPQKNRLDIKLYKDLQQTKFNTYTSNSKSCN